MLKEIKSKNNKQMLIVASAILFFIFSFAMLFNGVINNSQSEWAIIPDIRLVGEYKIGDGEWKPIVEGEHISATKGNVMLKGVLKICNPEDGGFIGNLTEGSLMSFTLNHINLALADNEQIIEVFDTENPIIGEDFCGHMGMVTEYSGEDGYFEAVISNYHRYGNETAVDEFLSSMKLYASDYSDKIVLRSGQGERVLAIIIIISAFIVLGITIFSAMLYRDIFRTSFFGGLLILSAGVFFLFTSEAFYLWFDTVIFNTMLTGLSVMVYVLFAVLLVKSLFSGKSRKVADAVILLYSLFISVLVGIPLLSKIYFYDMIAIWAVGAVAVSLMFIVLALISVKAATGKQRNLLLFVSLGLILFIADIVAVHFGLWEAGFLSKIYFLFGFVISLILSLHIVPENIKSARKAEQLEKEKIALDSELTQSRISTLMSQIHPHFIYNTLGSIEQLCELDPPKAAKLVNDFSKYLRGNFGEIDSPKLIRVSKELEHTKYYISIEKVRFPDIEFVTEMTCSDFCLPALTIQPIVENAVKHGILKREKGGRVKVKIYETDSSYFISVKDNGIGFDVVEIEQKNHVGLRNIKSRLDAMCSGVLHIESIIGVGTKITVEIPKEAD